MLAPTRELVAELNQRARTHRLDARRDPSPEVRLADGNPATAGDLIITRSNDRRLRVSAHRLGQERRPVDRPRRRPDGGVAVHAHTATAGPSPCPPTTSPRPPSSATPPPCTPRKASPPTPCTAWPPATSPASSCTRCSPAAGSPTTSTSQVVGDGDPHSIIRPETVTPAHRDRPPRADPRPRRRRRLRHHPAARARPTPPCRLGDAAARYLDALAGGRRRPRRRQPSVASLDARADQMVPGVVDAPAWPTLRAHLLLLAADGTDPIAALGRPPQAANSTPPTTPPPSWTGAWTTPATAAPAPGRCRGCPASRKPRATTPTWGDYLHAAEPDWSADLAEQVHDGAGADPDAAGWAPPARAARATAGRRRRGVAGRHGRRPADRRPTGAAAASQGRRPLAAQPRPAASPATGSPALHEWGRCSTTSRRPTRRDRFTPMLADRLAADLPRRAGRPRSCSTPRSPERPAARRPRRRRPVVADRRPPHPRRRRPARPTARPAPPPGPPAGRRSSAPTGPQALQASAWWPPLVTAVDHGVARGWPLDDLLADTPEDGRRLDGVECQALVWRISALTDPTPHPTTIDRASAGPHEVPPSRSRDADGGTRRRCSGLTPGRTTASPTVPRQRRPVEPTRDDACLLADAARGGPCCAGSPGPLQTTTPEVDAAARPRWHEQPDHPPVPPQRMIEVNQLAVAYYPQPAPASGRSNYLADRFGEDLTGDPRLPARPSPRRLDRTSSTTSAAAASPTTR